MRGAFYSDNYVNNDLLSLDRDTCSSVPLDDRCYLEIKSLYTQHYENGR